MAKNDINICGCCGEVAGHRHRKPTDPEWWGDAHWPTPLPHERGGLTVKNISVPDETHEIKESTKKTAGTSSIGLITVHDFIQETKNRGLFGPVIVNKIKAWFAKLDREECSPGMARMQCNNLLKSAEKKLQKGKV